MGANDVRAGGAFVEIGGVTKGMEAALDRAAGRLKAFGASVSSIGLKMASLGAAVTAPLIAAAAASASSSAAIYDMSRRTGIAVESLSTLGFAAKLSGSSMEDFETNIKRMQKTIGGVADPTEGTTGSLDHLGIALEKIRGQAPDEQFRMIAGAINNIKDPTARASAAMKVFGKSGTDVLPMIEQLGQLEATARRLGLVKTTESARSGKEYAQTLQLAELAAKKLWDALAEGVLPILKEKTETLVRLTVRIRDWIKANQSTVAIIFQVATAVTVAGVAFIALGKGLSIVGSAVGGVSSALGIVRSSLSGATTIITTVLTSGIGLAAVALIGLAGYLLYTSDVGQQALSALGEYFGQLKDTAVEAFQGIKNALAAKDFKLAAQILWLGVKVAFEEGIAPLKTLWAEFKSGFVKVAVGAFDGFLAAWEIARNAFTVGWIKMSEYLGGVFDAMITTVKNSFRSLVGFALKVELKVPGMKKLLGLEGSDESIAAAIDEVVAQENFAADKADQAAQTKRSDAAAKRLKEEADRNKQALAGIGADFNALSAGADAAAKAAIESGKAQLKDLQKELNAASQKAKSEAAAKAKPESLLPELPKTPLLGKDALIGVFKSIAVAGTFSGAGARGLGAGNPAERTAKATESTARVVAQILQKLASAGPLKFT